jgi:hypothetical protein
MLSERQEKNTEGVQCSTNRLYSLLKLVYVHKGRVNTHNHVYIQN